MSNTTKSRKANVRWTPAEEKSLIEACHEWYMQSEEGQKLTVGIFVQLMQDALTEDRWRNIQGFSNIPELHKRILQEIGQLGAPRSSPPLHLSRPPAPTAPTHSHERKSAVRWDEREEDIIVEASILEFHSNPTQGITHHVVEKAMHKALPDDRWRKFTGFSQISSVQEKLFRRLNTIIEQGIAPPPPPIFKEVPVEKPVDSMKIVRNFPLPTLVGIAVERLLTDLLASREEQAPVVHNGTRPSPQQLVEEALAKSGIERPEDIHLTFPRVQFVGIRRHQFEWITERLKRHPITLLPNPIDPSSVPDAALVSKEATAFVIEQKCTSEVWLKIVRENANGKPVEKKWGQNAIVEHCRDLAVEWRRQHPIEAKLLDQLSR